MPNVIDYLIEHDDARDRITKYIVYFWIVGGVTYSVSLLIARLFFWH
jgi:hypothetical protein